MVDEGSEQDPVEVLLDLAKSGEIDAWDIDLSKVTEKFLEHIDTLKSNDLRIPARTLLYASILLRMKSDFMEEDDEGDDDLPDEYEEPPGWFYRKETLPKPPIRRRSRRPVTLVELISELKNAESVAKRREVRRESRPEEPVEADIDKAHEEGIEERIKSLKAVIYQKLEREERVAFTEIGGDVLDYLSVLFMANRREIWLEQDRIFGELYLRRYPSEVSSIYSGEGVIEEEGLVAGTC